MKAYAELTGLFCGEANYCWVKRAEFDCDNMTNLAIVRKAKQLLDISGLKAQYNKGWDSEDIARYFKGVVMFISFEYE